MTIKGNGQKNSMRAIIHLGAVPRESGASSPGPAMVCRTGGSLP